MFTSGFGSSEIWVKDLGLAVLEGLPVLSDQSLIFQDYRAC